MKAPASRLYNCQLMTAEPKSREEVSVHTLLPYSSINGGDVWSVTLLLQSCTVKVSETAKGWE